MQRKTKDFIKSIPFIYKLSLIYVNYINSIKRSRAYHNHGKEALELFVRCLNNNGFNYTLAFGSILGAIREHGFIKHDLDIDIFMWYDDFRPDLMDKLANDGFQLYRSISIDSGKEGREDTFIFKGVNIDVFYLYPALDIYPYCCDFVSVLGQNKRMPRRIEIPITRDRKLVMFEGIEVYVPSNAEEICEFRYGPNYMTPDPNWHWRSAYNATKDWPEKMDKTNEICYY